MGAIIGILIQTWNRNPVSQTAKVDLAPGIVPKAKDAK